MRYTLCFFLWVFFLILSACRFNPEIQGTGIAFLQGEWTEDSVPYQDKLLEYTRHHFVFTCDSFYATLETHAKTNRYPNNCYNNGSWKEYAKGNYVVIHDTLYLIGTFTKENFKQKISGCYRIGRYVPMFLIKEASPHLIKLDNLQNHLPVILKLKKRIICHPKPL